MSAEAAREVLNVFVAYKVKPRGKLKRTHFMAMRDDVFTRGLEHALDQKWLVRPYRDRYTYILTEDGYKAGCTL